MEGVPSRIKVGRAAETPFIGRYGDGLQFMSFVVRMRGAASREEQVLAVQHLFDPEGRHVETRTFPAGPVSDRGAQRRAEEKQQEWLRQLKTLLLGPIEISPFRDERDGLVFGLQAESGGTLLLVPNGLRFAAPWDGSYTRS